MVWTNALPLDLGISYSRVHPDFNLSLLTPYMARGSAGWPLLLAPVSLVNGLAVLVRNWQHVVGILDFRVSGRQSP